MIHSTIIGRLWGEPEDRITTTGKSLINLTLSFQERDKSYRYIKLCLWGDKFNRVVPMLKHGTTVFVQGILAIDSYLSRTKGETVVSLTLHVDSLQVIFQPTLIKREEPQRREVEEVHFASEEETSQEGLYSQDKDFKIQEEEEFDWGGAGSRI